VLDHLPDVFLSYLDVVLAYDSVEEFSKTLLPRRWDLSFDERLKPATIPTDTPAATFDWRSHGVVTPVKNQVTIQIFLCLFDHLSLCELLQVVPRLP